MKHTSEEVLPNEVVGHFMHFKVTQNQVLIIFTMYFCIHYNRKIN